MNSLALLIIVIGLIILRNIIKTPNYKGKLGELKVASRLNRLNNEEYKVLNDVMLHTNKSSNQIDHLVVSIYGIFVIETKNYSGWIHGSENSEYWTKTYYKNKTKFRNPIKQNWAHILALKELLNDYKHIKYHSIVAFTKNAVLKNVFTNQTVIYDNQIYDTIMAEQKEINLTKEQVKKITDEIVERNDINKTAKKKHIDQVKNSVYERSKKEKALICPKCGGKLVVRNGPYGKFYGCKNYPNCRYKKSYK